MGLTQNFKGSKEKEENKAVKSLKVEAKRIGQQDRSENEQKSKGKEFPYLLVETILVNRHRFDAE
jgi:hypothetical protein